MAFSFIHRWQKAARKEEAFAVGAPTMIWQILFFYLPLSLMLFTSILKLPREGMFQGFTLEHFLPLFSKAHFFIIFRSLSLAFLTALLCLFLAFPLAHFIAFRSGRFKILLLFFLLVPFWTNFLLHVYAWHYILEREGIVNNFLRAIGLIENPIHFLNSFFAILLMMVYCYIPFMVLPIFSSLDRFDQRLLEVSHNLGASWGQTMRNIMLPLTFPAIRAGFFLVFIPSFGEFIIPELMGGNKQYFVGSVVSKYIMGNQTEGRGAAFMVLSCLALLITAAFFYIIFKKLSKSFTRGIK